MAVRTDHRTWVRKLDGEMHVVAQQPQLRLYPGTLDELEECVAMIGNPPLGAIPQARAVGSHWTASATGVTGGYMVETATPVHELDVRVAETDTTRPDPPRGEGTDDAR